MTNQAIAIARRELVTKHIAATTLWYFDVNGIEDLSYKPSDWRAALYRLIEKSDPDNRGKINLAFPGEVAAFRLAQHANGMEILRAIATSSAVESEGDAVAEFDANRRRSEQTSKPGAVSS